MRKIEISETELMKPVDLVHLAHQTYGDADLEREILNLFVTQSKLYLARMKEAENQRQWFEAAHTIKGSARGIGAWGVADAAEKAEGAKYRKGSRNAASLAGALEDELGETNAFIEDLFAA